MGSAPRAGIARHHRLAPAGGFYLGKLKSFGSLWWPLNRENRANHIEQRHCAGDTVSVIQPVEAVIARR